MVTLRPASRRVFRVRRADSAIADIAPALAIQHVGFMKWIGPSLAVVLTVMLQTSPVLAEQCLAGLGSNLAAGHFSGSIDCQHDKLTIHRVGQIRADGQTFTVYNYHYEIAPACSGCAVHGGQRIIVMRGAKYLGQYKSDGVVISIRDGKLRLFASDVAPSRGEPSQVIVPFTAAGPPNIVLLDDEDFIFFR